MRKLKADIKDNVWIKAQVEEIRITATGVKHKVAVNDIVHEVFEEDLEIASKDEPVKESVKKGPGRPKKTTLDELVMKCTK